MDEAELVGAARGGDRQAFDELVRRTFVDTFTLACEDCKRRNYITMKSKVNDRERIEMKKYCRWDKRHTVHKETR